MEEKIIEKIFCSYRFFKKKIDQILKEKNINFIQFHILYFLKENQKINHKKMAQLLNIKLPTLTIFLDKMIDERLIRKQASIEDKRNLYILLTNKGEKILREARSEIRQFIYLILKKFTNKEKKLFSNLINKISFEF